MNVLRMSLTGSNLVGWTWRVWVGEQELVRTHPLDGNDLGAALFEIGRDASRHNPFFDEVPDDDLFLILEGFFNGPLYDALRASAEEQVWARHEASPSVSTVICSRMYLVACPGKPDRLLVSQNGERKNFVLAEGSFDRALREAIARLESAVPVSPSGT